MADLKQLIADNGERWSTAQFNASRLSVASKVAVRLCNPKAKAVYKSLETKTGVPWWAIAVIHEREASQKWDRSIAQGDPWNKVSKNVPRGRGPFKSFEDAAVDALVNCAPHASKWKDWSNGGALTLLELYNGTGYEDHHNMPSPYIWAGTQHYKRGKYVADGKFDPNAVDTQLGCAIMLRAMSDIDPSVPFGEQQFDRHGIAAIDPSEYPDADDAPPTAGDDVPQPETVDDVINNVVPTAGKGLLNKMPTITPEGVQKVVANAAKPMIASKQTWVSGAIFTMLGWFGLSSDKLNASFLEKLEAVVTSQGFLILCMMILVGVLFYLRWRDHGRGALKAGE